MPPKSKSHLQAKRVTRSAVPPNEIDRPDRRRDILRSAEMLFATRGYAAVSVRDIATEARVPIALVGYYFGRKQQLFFTVFEHRKASVDERIKRISEVDCSYSNPRAVDDLVRAWAEPVMGLRASEAGDAFSLLVARTAWDPGPEATEIIKRIFDPLAAIFIDKICEALPNCPRERLIWGYEYALGALLMHIADKRIERLSNGAITSGDPTVIDEFVQFVSTGFRALSAGRCAVGELDEARQRS